MQKITKEAILLVGMWGVGKSFYSERFIKGLPNFIIPKEPTIEEIKKHEFVITDYYFINDYNAEKLKKELGCNVEIIVLFDKPENISYRQIYFKEQRLCEVSCNASINLYLKNLRKLIYPPNCRFYDCFSNQYFNYYEFLEKFNYYLKPYTKEEIEELVNKIKITKGYDYDYQEIDLPFGFKLGKEGYSKNKETWNILKDMISFKNKKVLDLCCFNSEFSRQIYLNGGYPVGVDKHKDAIYYASIINKIKNTNFPLFLSDIEKEIPERYFDIALLMNVFHHLKDKERILKRLSIFPLVIFEVNKEDKEKIEKYFVITKEEKSPKDNRIILMGVPK